MFNILFTWPSSNRRFPAGKGCPLSGALHLDKAALLTHFHSDSAGGLRALGEEELLVYAHESEAAAVQEYLEKEHTLCPVTGAMASTTLATVGDRLVLQDDSQEVVILNVGWNPHTDNMLVVWLPRQRILYTTELLTAIDGQPDPKQARLNQFFMNWVVESGLNPEVIRREFCKGILERHPG